MKVASLALRARSGFVEGLSALLTAVAALSVVGALVASWHTGSVLLLQQSVTNTDANSVLALEARWDALANASDALGVPAYDVNGKTVTDGHETAFATRDGREGTFAFTSFVYNSGTKTLTEVTYTTRSSNGAAANVSTVRTYGNVTSFVASPKKVTDFNEPALGATAPKDQPVNVGYSDLLGGNRLVQIDFAIGKQKAEYVLASRIAPFGAAVTVGTAAPAPTTLSLAPTNLGFANNGTTAQVFSASEPRYIGPFATTACNAADGSQLATITSAGSNGPNNSWSIQPTNPWGGACTITVTDQVGNSGNVTISVGANYGPLTISAASLVFAYGGDTDPTAYDSSGNASADSNGMENIWENYYRGPFTWTDGDVNGNNACGSSISNTWVNSGTLTSTGYTASSSIGAATVPSPVTCAITVRDNHGGAQTLRITIYVKPVYSLSVNPTTIVTDSGGAISWTATSTLTNSGSVKPGTASTQGVYLANVRVGPGGGACGNWNPTSVSPSGTTFSATMSSGICYVDVDDQAGNVVTVTLKTRAYSLNVNPTSATIQVGQSASWKETDNETTGYGGGNTNVEIVNPRGSGCSGANFNIGQWYGSGTTFSVGGSSAGTCQFDVQDSHGNTSTVTIVVQQPNGPLQVATSSGGPWSGSVNLVFGSPAAGAQTAYVQETSYIGSFNLNASACNGYAQVTSAPGSGPGPSGITISPQAQTTGCAISITDSNGQTATINVVVQAPSCKAGCTIALSGGYINLYWYIYSASRDWTVYVQSVNDGSGISTPWTPPPGAVYIVDIATASGIAYTSNANPVTIGTIASASTPTILSSSNTSYGTATNGDVCAGVQLTFRAAGTGTYNAVLVGVIHGATYTSSGTYRGDGCGTYFQKQIGPSWQIQTY